MLALIKSYLKKGGYARMAQISESLEALRKEAPARFLESDQFQEMRKTYEKLKPLGGHEAEILRQAMLRIRFPAHLSRDGRLFVRP